MTQTSARSAGTTTSSSGPAAPARCWPPGSPRTPGAGAAAGGRPRGRGRRDLDPGRLLGPVQDPVGLELHDHRAEAAAQPAGLLAADEGARRLLVDERDDLHPRQPRPTTTPGATSTAPQGWGYDDVLPYFVRAEGNTRLGAPYHGQDGPLHVEDRRYTHELTDLWVESAVSAGMKPTDDFNGAEQEGAGLYQVTCNKGRRWSVNDGLPQAGARRGPTSTSRPVPSPPGSWSRATAPSGSPTGVGGREVTAHARRARCCSAAARSTARSC